MTEINKKKIRELVYSYTNASVIFNEFFDQICQLFTQSLGDKELREKIASRVANDAIYHKDKPFLHTADEILALLQQKIEEARRQEGERIIKYLEKNACVNFTYGLALSVKDWQALKGGE